MQRMLLPVVLLALLGASSLFGLDDQTYEVGTAIEPIPLPPVPEGSGTPPYTYSISPELPAGLTFDSETRTISGTPTAATPATEYAYTVTDGAGASASQPLFKIEVQAAPLVELSDAYAYEVGTAIESITLPPVPEGSGTPPYRYSISPELPAGLTFDPATRTLSGTPTAAAATTVYTYTVTDGAGASASRPLFSIEVQGAAPIELSDAYTYEVGWAIEPVVLPLVTGGTGDLTYSLSPDPPAGLTYDPATRTLSGTPTAEAATTVYTYTVTDEAGARRVPGVVRTSLR